MGGLALSVFTFPVKITCLLPKEKSQPSIKYEFMMPLFGEILPVNYIQLIHVLPAN